MSIAIVYIYIYIYFQQIILLPVACTDVEWFSCHDTILSTVIRYTRKDRPNKVPDSLKPFLCCRYKMTMEGVCLQWRSHLVIPSAMKGAVLRSIRTSGGVQNEGCC